MSIQPHSKGINMKENQIHTGDNSMLYLNVVRKLDDKIAISFKKDSHRLMIVVEGNVNYYMDIDNAGKLQPKIRKIGRKLIRQKKNGKIPIFGTHQLTGVISSFIMGMFGKIEMFFSRLREKFLHNSGRKEITPY